MMKLKVTWPPLPYKGLSFYTEEDSGLFAGRRNDVERCGSLLSDWKSRVLLLHGATACGKSSFLRAGLIPYLEELNVGIEFARTNEHDVSSILFVRSTREPLAKLCDAIYRYASRTIEIHTPVGPHKINLSKVLPSHIDNVQFRREFGEHPEGLMEILGELGRIATKTIVIVIDQGEEVLTLDQSKEGDQRRARFFNFISLFRRAELDIKLLIALRTEYFGRFISQARQSFRGGGITEYYLDDLDREQLEEALLRPTLDHQVGVLPAPYEVYKFRYHPDVAERIVSQLEGTAIAGGKLPALQIVCATLYGKASVRGRPFEIGMPDFDDLGGIEGCIDGFIDDQLTSCARRQELKQAEIPKELERWKLCLYGLSRLQPDGTVTTEIRPEADLRKELQSSQLDFDKTTSELASDEVRLLRRISVVETRTGASIPCFALGHDTLGLVLRKWKLESDKLRAISIAQSFEESQAEVLTDPDELSNEKDGIALCLSGNGYRAMLFDLGGLWRLNEIGYLPRLSCVSSVAAGSIVAGLLGSNWGRLEFNAEGVAVNFIEVIAKPLMNFAEVGLDVPLALVSVILFGRQGHRIEKAFKSHLYGDATLQSLPDSPRFIFKATNLQTSSIFSFSKAYCGDSRIGRISRPQIPIAIAIAASAGFPPFHSPVVLEVDPSSWSEIGGADLNSRSFKEKIYLADGVLSDNFAARGVWERYSTIFISDGAAASDPVPDTSTGVLPQIGRMFDLLFIQLRSVQKRQIISDFVLDKRRGAYWSISSNISSYSLPNALHAPYAQTIELARIPSQFAFMDPQLGCRLINWGYAVCDAAIRKSYDKKIVAPRVVPYPIHGI